MSTFRSEIECYDDKVQVAFISDDERVTYLFNGKAYPGHPLELAAISQPLGQKPSPALARRLQTEATRLVDSYLRETGVQSLMTPPRAATILDAWGACLPVRIANEELGDYLEDITRRLRAGQRWAVWVRVAAAVLWTGVSAIGYALRAGDKKSTG